MSDKAVLVDFGLTVQMTEDVYIPRDLRGTEVRKETRELARPRKSKSLIDAGAFLFFPPVQLLTLTDTRVSLAGAASLLLVSSQLPQRV